MPLMGRTADERRRERTDARLAANAHLIPEGMYCYTHVADPELDESRRARGMTAFIPGRFIPCPFLEARKDKPEQANGYCRLLRKGDWMKDGTFLLWDQCKECGVKMDVDDDGPESVLPPSPERERGDD